MTPQDLGSSYLSLVLNQHQFRQCASPGPLTVFFGAPLGCFPLSVEGKNIAKHLHLSNKKNHEFRRSVVRENHEFCRAVGGKNGKICQSIARKNNEVRQSVIGKYHEFCQSVARKN